MLGAATHSELVHVGLSQQHRTGTPQPLDHGAEQALPAAAGGRIVDDAELHRLTSRRALAGEFADAIGMVIVDQPRRFCRVVIGAVGAKPLVLSGATQAFAQSAAPPPLNVLKDEIASTTFEADPAKLHMAAVAMSRAMHAVGAQS